MGVIVVPYSGLISREKIFANFTDLLLCVTLLFANAVLPIRCSCYKNAIREFSGFPGTLYSEYEREGVFFRNSIIAITN